MKLIAFTLSSIYFFCQSLEISLIPKAGYPPAYALYSSMACINSCYIFGGTDSFVYSNSIYAFNFTSLSWSLINSVSEFQPSPRIFTALFVFNSNLYVYGGQSAQGLRDDLWLFDIKNAKWTYITQAGSIPPARSQTAFYVTGNFFYVFGGITLNGVDNGFYK
jgi:N-acetylneuraminic acid mutarotase